MAQAVGFAGVTRAVELLHTDLLEIGSLITNEIFSELDFSTIEAIQNKDVNYIFSGNEKVATKYTPGKTPNATLGEVFERELQVKNVATNIYDNLQLYREKVPFDIVGISDGGALNCPETEKRLRQVARRFANHIYRNLVAGDRSLAVGNGYELYDGLNTLVKKDIQAGKIDTGKGNLQLLTKLDLTDKSDEAKVAAYEMFDAFVLDWDEDLQDADKVNVMMSKKLAQYITQGAALKFGSNIQQTIMTANDGIHFFDRQNIVLKPTKVIGRGQQMFAYTPGNIVFGTDLSRVGDPEGAFIEVSKLQGDPNILDFFMQLAVGMRIDLINPENFCMALDETSGGTYNTFKTLEGTVTESDTIPSGPAFDISSLTPAQIASLKEQLGIA